MDYCSKCAECTTPTVCGHRLRSLFRRPMIRRSLNVNNIAGCVFVTDVSGNYQTKCVCVCFVCPTLRNGTDRRCQQLHRHLLSLRQPNRYILLRCVVLFFCLCVGVLVFMIVCFFCFLLCTRLSVLFAVQRRHDDGLCFTI